jgi:hypothetical protein
MNALTITVIHKASETSVLQVLTVQRTNFQTSLYLKLNVILTKEALVTF